MPRRTGKTRGKIRRDCGAIGMSVKEDIKRSIKKSVRIVGRTFYRKHIWLVSDRAWVAGDNGEAFFRYIQDKPVNSCFAISRKSPDYEKMKAIGKVVDYNSLWYKFLLCVADVHISSHENHMACHKETPQVFLSHGISYKDIHDYFNSFWHENLIMIVTSKEEIKQLLLPSSRLRPEQIFMTGYPRYDRLEEGPNEKIITLAFSWRRFLWDASEKEFLESDCYKVYTSFFELTDLLDEIRKAGYIVRIKLHPHLEKFRSGFRIPESVEFWDSEATYREIYKKSSLIISDYSSAIYDFVYMMKPILYYQPDMDKLLKLCGDEYGFDYKNKGMGDVARTKDELKLRVQEYLNNNCAMKELYRQRVDEFFEYRDKNNSKRVYEVICNYINRK